MSEGQAIRPVFWFHHKSESRHQDLLEAYDFISFAHEWELGVLKKPLFDLYPDDLDEFMIIYTVPATSRFGFIDDEYQNISRDKIKRFYAHPSAAHFVGLLLGWSLVNGALESFDDLAGADSGASWTRVDDECWHGDIDSVILNLTMPKDGGGACGCGSNYSAVLALDKFLCTQRNHPFVDNDETRTGHLNDTVYRDDLLGKAFWFIAYVLDAGGFTEHGGGISHGWLQMKGVLLALLIGESIKMSEENQAE